MNRLSHVGMAFNHVVAAMNRFTAFKPASEES